MYTHDNGLRLSTTARLREKCGTAFLFCTFSSNSAFVIGSVSLPLSSRRNAGDLFLRFLFITKGRPEPFRALTIPGGVLLPASLSLMVQAVIFGGIQFIQQVQLMAAKSCSTPSRWCNALSSVSPNKSGCEQFRQRHHPADPVGMAVVNSSLSSLKANTVSGKKTTFKLVKNMMKRF